MKVYCLLIVVSLNVLSLGCIEYSWESDNLTEIDEVHYSTFIAQESSIVIQHDAEKKIGLFNNSIVIKGNVTNTGNETIFLSKVVVNFYDNRGQLIDLGMDDYPELSMVYLMPNEERSINMQRTIKNPLSSAYYRFFFAEYYRLSVGT